MLATRFPDCLLIRVHTVFFVLTTPRPGKYLCFWQGTYAEVTQNRTKPPKFAEIRFVRRPDVQSLERQS